MFMGMTLLYYNGWLMALVNNRVINGNSYNAYQEDEVLVFVPVIEDGMSKPTLRKVAPLPIRVAPVDLIPALIPAQVQAPIINLYPQAIFQLDSDNLFRRLNLGRGLHRSAIDLRRPTPTKSAPAEDEHTEDLDFVDVGNEF